MKQKNTQALPANRQFIPDEMKKVAESYEKQFAQFLLKEFHKSIPRSQDNSTAKDIYEGWMINEQSEAIAKNQEGLGIKDLVLDEIYPRKYRNEEAYNSFLQARANQALKAKNAYGQIQLKNNELDSVRIKPKTGLEINKKRKGVSHE